MRLSTTLQEPVPAVVSSEVSEPKPLGAEKITTMVTDFLKRLGHKGAFKPKRVSWKRMFSRLRWK